jgi:hypothetical protein
MNLIFIPLNILSVTFKSKIEKWNPESRKEIDLGRFKKKFQVLKIKIKINSIEHNVKKQLGKNHYIPLIKIDKYIQYHI